ncbi:hypothetical protein F5146DRAFT_1192571 [Armillaria mellea]|nr:hypothetical protein F5146DRAFT_1192571 [Armillaria mellea]
MAHRGLLDLPGDTWLEVVSYLGPLDLSRLARLCKGLRAIFTSPTSTQLWKASGKTVDCPAPVTGFSDVAWANLMYGKKCHFCHVAEVPKVEFSFLTRICMACRKEHVISHRATDPVTSLIALLVPAVLKGRTLQYLRKDFEAVKAKYLSLPDNNRDAYCDERWAYLKEVDNVSLIGTAWLKQRTEALHSEELERKKTNRAAAIKKKLKSIDYRDAFQSEDFRLAFDKHSGVNDPSRLTTQCWTKIRDDIIKIAREEIKELADEHLAHVLVVENRTTVITALLEEPDASRITKVPSIVDFLDVSRYKTLIESPISTTLTEKELKPLVDAFRKEWMVQTLDKLIQVLGEIQPEQLTKDQKRDYLELARIVFKCRGCSSRGLLFPQVLEHECCIYSRDPQTVGLEQRCVWTAEYLSTQQSAFMSTFMRGLGLDPDSATVDDIDSLDQPYSCSTCPDAYHLDGEPKNVYKWRPFIDHVDGHLSGRTAVPSDPQDSEDTPLERIEDDPVTSNTQTNVVARRGFRLPESQSLA